MKEFDFRHSLLAPFICDAIATKEDRRIQRIKLPAASSSSSSSNNQLNGDSSVPMKLEDNNNHDDGFIEHQNGSTTIVPSTISLKYVYFNDF